MASIFLATWEATPPTWPGLQMANGLSQQALDSSGQVWGQALGKQSPPMRERRACCLSPGWQAPRVRGS